MNMRDRMLRANPVLGDLVDRIDALIKGHNELVSIVFRGNAPHKADDTTNVVSVNDAGEVLDDVVDMSIGLRAAYEAHRQNATAHIAADSTNTIADATVLADIKTLADELKDDINAHMSDGTTAHTEDDDVTPQIDAADVTTKASAITLANQILAAYEAHRVVVEDAAEAVVHGAADETNVVALGALESDATYAEIAAVLDAVRTAYEAHRVLTTSSVHAAADNTNSVTASAIGSVQTSVNTLLNELKTDFNAHILLATSHYVADRSVTVEAANATTLATSRALANALKENYNDHISRADQVAAGPVIPALDSE